MDDPFADLRGKLPGALSVYVSTWCWDCRRLEKFLSRHSVPHETVNISKAPEAAARLEAETGKRGVPAVLVRDSRWVRGYHSERPGNFDEKLFIEELAKAL